MTKKARATDEQIAQMLRDGHSKAAIKRELGAGYPRIAVVASTLDAAGEGFFDDDDAAIVETIAETDADNAPETVVVDVTYFRALEALLGEVEENQRLRRARDAA